MGGALDHNLGEKRRTPQRRRRWLSYSLRGLFVLVLLAALPAWWIRNQLDGFAAEHEAIELLRSQGATVYTKPAEPEWLWKHLPGGTTPPRVARGQPVGGDRDEEAPPRVPIDRSQVLRDWRARLARGSAAPQGASGQQDSGTTRRKLPAGDAVQAADAAAPLESRRRRPEAAQRVDAEPAGAPASRNPRNANRRPPGSPALMLREHATIVRLPRGKGDDAQMKLVARFVDLEHLSVDHGKITDAGLAYCAALRNLVGLDLDGCKSITDDGLRQLRRAKKLESLRLNSTHVGDRGMAFVAELPALKWLLASDTEIGNHGLRQIARVETLECLGLTGTKVDDRGVGELARCTKLRQLHLPTGVTAAGLAQLSSLEELTMLGVSAGGQLPLAPFQKLESLDVRLQATDDGGALRDVKRLPKLRFLRISGGGVNDATLLALAGIRKGCRITVTGGSITAEGVGALRPVLELGCSVTFEEAGFTRDDIPDLRLPLPGSVTVWPKQSINFARWARGREPSRGGNSSVEAAQGDGSVRERSGRRATARGDTHE